MKRRCWKTGKRRYGDEIQAKFALGGARRDARRDPARRNECRVYACPDCQGWHLTSQKEWMQR